MLLVGAWRKFPFVPKTTVFTDNCIQIWTDLKKLNKAIKRSVKSRLILEKPCSISKSIVFLRFSPNLISFGKKHIVLN